MKSESRNSKPDPQQLRSALTPSELAALLGPCAAQSTEPKSVAAGTATSRWALFAETFASRLTTRLRPLIRAAVRVTCSGSELRTAESLTIQKEAREVLVRLCQTDRSLEPVAVVLSVPLVASFVDRLLGGRSASNSDETDLHLPLTVVDQRLASRLNDAVRQSMTEAAQLPSALPLTELPDTANSLVEAWLPDSPLLQLSFDVRFVQGGGSLDLLLPCEVAESLVEQSHELDSPKPVSSSLPAEWPLESSRRSVIMAQLGQTSLSKRDLKLLAVGDVLLIDSPLDQTVRVFVEGCPVFSGIAGISHGHKAIRLTDSAAVRTS